MIDLYLMHATSNISQELFFFVFKISRGWILRSLVIPWTFPMFPPGMFPYYCIDFSTSPMDDYQVLSVLRSQIGFNIWAAYCDLEINLILWCHDCAWNKWQRGVGALAQMETTQQKSGTTQAIYLENGKNSQSKRQVGIKTRKSAQCSKQIHKAQAKIQKQSGNQAIKKKIQRTPESDNVWQQNMLDILTEDKDSTWT